jgi:hypothetical protein
MFFTDQNKNHRRKLGWQVLRLVLVAASTPPVTGHADIYIPSQEAVGSFPVEETTSAVPWTAQPLRVDGDLADWPSGAPTAVLAGDSYTHWNRGIYGGRKDLSADIRICRDENNIYLAAIIADDQAPTPNRISVAFADVKSKLITDWRDVGQRYGADDVHVIFTLGQNDTVGLYWAHVQQRMDHSVTQDSFGSETERRALLEQNQGAEKFQSKIFAKTSHAKRDGESVVVFEASFPWKTLLPYDPASYAPLKMNIAVEDKDGEGAAARDGWAAWAPGLAGVYSAAHFPSLTFTPPVEHGGVDTFAQTPAYNYINSKIQTEFSFFNHGAARKGQLQLFDDKNDQPVATSSVTLPHGFSQQKLVVHSEKVTPGRRKLTGVLVMEGEAPLRIAVNAPTFDDVISVHSLAEYQAKIAALEKNTAALEQLYQKVKAKGLDTAYPLAYVTLQKMFIPRCREDLERGDTDRVQKNTQTLEVLYEHSKSYMEKILANPAAQLKVPPRFDPDKLQMKAGYYFNGDKPVFLWGPAVFWFLRKDQQKVIDLGFNSVTPEVPQELSNPEVVEHLQAWYRAGVSINANLSVPDLALTGADANKSKLLQEHPDLKNLDPNNFLPFIVQHPTVQPVIRATYEKNIAFWRGFHGVRSYWLWNEPWYTNYSERTRQDFIEQYLKPRYQTIAALNQRWNSQYKSFDEIQLIKWPDPKNYAPWYDFQQFRDDVLGDFFCYLSDTAQQIDPRRPTHTKFMSASLHSFNIAQLQKCDSINGFDGSSGDRDIVFLDYDRSVYPERPLVNTEIHIAYAGKKAVEMVAWRLALHGLADGNWWCWHSNQRFSDSLSNAESMQALTTSGLDLQRLFDPYLYALNRKPQEIATLFPDVVERRSDLSMVRIRFELATAQYALGLQPFYAIESQITRGDLSKHKVLLAGESDYVKESTYQSVLKFVRDGGTLIVTRGGFAHDEYGAPRDTSDLIKPDGGAAYGEDARSYPLGKGHVVCITAIEDQPDVVADGGQALRGGPAPENQVRRRVYQQVLARVMAEQKLEDEVRIVSSAADPDALYGVDWRSAKVGKGYVLTVLPYMQSAPFSIKLETKRPIRKIVNLITEKEIAPKKFKLEDGPNLFYIELKK